MTCVLSRKNKLNVYNRDRDRDRDRDNNNNNVKQL